jgi:hypothetical protein
MATSTAAGNVAANIRVDKSVGVPNGYGTADGWTFTLPAGVGDNDLFDIVGDDVKFKAIYYPVDTYNITVQMARAGWVTKNHSFTVNVRDRGALIAAGANIDVGIIGNYSSAGTKKVRFNCYFDAALPSGFVATLFSDTLSPTGSGTQDGTSFIQVYKDGSNHPVIVITRNSDGYHEGAVAAAAVTTSKWVAFEIQENAGVITCYIDGVLVLTRNDNLRMNLSSHCYFSRAASPTGGKLVISNPYFEKDSVVIFLDEMTAAPAGATISGTVTFNDLGDAS